jgi:hypothetical protein
MRWPRGPWPSRSLASVSCREPRPARRIPSLIPYGQNIDPRLRFKELRRVDCCSALRGFTGRPRKQCSVAPGCLPVHRCLCAGAIERPTAGITLQKLSLISPRRSPAFVGGASQKPPVRGPDRRKVQSEWSTEGARAILLISRSMLASVGREPAQARIGARTGLQLPSCSSCRWYRAAARPRRDLRRQDRGRLIRVSGAGFRTS